MNIKYMSLIKALNHKYTYLPALYSLILQFKPKKIIEYGTELGGTTMTMAFALKQLMEEEGHAGKIFTYDLFAGYEGDPRGDLPGGELVKIGKGGDYRNAMNCVKETLSNPFVKDFIEVNRGDFFDFCEQKDKEFDLLYVDVDNDGDKLLKMYDACKDNIEKGDIVLFEGGSETRDNVKWMIDQNRKKMNEVKEIVGYQF